jgi:mannosyltransferase
MDFLLQHTVLKYLAQSFWRDEAFSWAMAVRGLEAIPLTARDFNPPLYYLLLAAWMSVAGTSELALRSLSLVFFVATLWLAWRYLRDCLDVPGSRAGVYLLLIGVNPFLLYYAVEARMYSMLAFLAAASFYTFQTRRTILYLLSTVAGLYTHYFMVFVPLVQLTAVLVESRDWSVLRRRVGVIVIPLLVFAPWLLTSLSNKTEVTFWADPPGWRFGIHLLTAVFTGHDPTYGFLDRSERWLFVLGLVPAALLGLRALQRADSARFRAVFTIALWGLLPPLVVFTISMVQPVFVPRYLIFCTLGLLLFFVAGLERVRPALRTALVAVLFALSIGYQVAQAHRHSKGDYRGTITEIERQAQADDVLYVSNQLDFFPALYYYDASRVYLVGHRMEEIAPYVGKVLIPALQVIATLPENAAPGFVLRNDHEFERTTGGTGLAMQRQRNVATSKVRR